MGKRRQVQSSGKQTSGRMRCGENFTGNCALADANAEQCAEYSGLAPS